MINAKRILATMAMVAALTIQAKTGTTSLNDTKQAVQFEIEQKDALRLQATKLNDTFDLLARTHVDDQQIIRTIKLSQDLGQLIQKLDDTNARQATLAEQIKQVTSEQELSPQEGKIYRQCGLVLTELAHAQNNLLSQASRQQKALERFFRRLPPPQTLTLANGLSFQLVATPEATFYASQMIPEAMAVFAPETKANDKLKIVTPTYRQAKEILKLIRKQTLAPLALPSRTQMMAMMKKNLLTPCAAWCADPFSARQSLKFNRGRQGQTDAAPKQQTLTPAQNNAAARFKIKFATVWDPRHQLSTGQDDFIRELPQAFHQKLGMFIVAPAQIGAQKRLNDLTQRLNAEN